MQMVVDASSWWALSSPSSSRWCTYTGTSAALKDPETRLITNDGNKNAIRKASTSSLTPNRAATRMSLAPLTSLPRMRMGTTVAIARRIWRFTDWSKGLLTSERLRAHSPMLANTMKTLR